MIITRSIPLYYKFVHTGETADLFHSFAPIGNELICAFRRHKIVDYAEWGSAENYYESKVMLQRFNICAGTPISEPEEAMAMGEDPRCVSVRGRPFVLSANPCGGPFNYVLFDVYSKKCLNIEVINRCNFKYGKNWQPFAFSDELYAVHGFSPFRILQIDTETGRAKIVYEKSMGLDLESPHDGFTQFRGGCSALVLGDQVVGFGHLTIDSGRHRLFQWVFSPSRSQVSLSFDLDVRPLSELGLKIIDPTCFFALKERLYLGVSCSNRDWFYGQTFVSLLLELQMAGSGGDVTGSLASVLGEAVLPLEGPSLADPVVHYFRAAELRIGNGTVSRNFEVISKVGKHEPGHIVFGPYINLCPGSYQLLLQYAGAASNSVEIGEIDACSASGSNVLARKQLLGTNGRLAVTTLDFKIREHSIGIGFETRVGSKGIADIRLTDISICRLE
jgi:hypothetical protein